MRAYEPSLDRWMELEPDLVALSMSTGPSEGTEEEWITSAQAARAATILSKDTLSVGGIVAQ